MDMYQIKIDLVEQPKKSNTKKTLQIQIWAPNCINLKDVKPKMEINIKIPK